MSVVTVNQLVHPCAGVLRGQYVEYNCNYVEGTMITVNYDGAEAFAWDSIAVIGNCDCLNSKYDPALILGSKETLVNITAYTDPIILSDNVNISNTVEVSFSKTCGTRKLRLYASGRPGVRLRNLGTATSAAMIEITNSLPYVGISYNAETGQISVPLSSIAAGI